MNIFGAIEILRMAISTWRPAGAAADPRRPTESVAGDENATP
jgi:hypothetical protein